MANEFKHKDPGGELTQAEFIAACGDGHIFACQATGDILYASSATVLKNLEKGAAGTILNMGGSCIPAWNASPSFTALTLSGALDVNGTIDYDGTCVDFLSSGDIDIVSSNDAAAAVYIAQSTGTSGTVKIHADTGTSVTEGAESVTILSDLGGVGIRSTANLANAINITVDGCTASTIQIYNDTGTSVTEGAASIALISDAGGVELRSTADLANAINLTVDSGTTSSIAIFNDTGNATGSICLKSDVGGITLNPATFVTVGGNATNAGEVRILEDTDNGSNYVALKAPNVSTSYTITLPTAVAGTCGFVLSSTTAGVTSWAAAGGDFTDGGDCGALVLGTNDSNSLTLETNNTARMVLAAGGDVTVSTGNVIIGTHAKGIDFTANTDDATDDSELLDDYEEGTWQPVVKFGAATPCGIDYDEQAGRYVKVGNLVTIQGTIVLTASGSQGGNMGIYGLPFSAGSNYPAAAGAGRIDGITFTTYLSLDLYNDFMQVVFRSTSGSVTAVTSGATANTAEFRFSLSYVLY